MDTQSIRKVVPLGVLGRIVLILALVLPAISFRSFSEIAHASTGQPFVILDPGHGGSDPGSPSTDVAESCGVPLDLKEKNVTLDIARRVRNILLLSGVRVELTRDDDVSVSLIERTNFINQKLPDLVVSIHTNSSIICGDGVEAWYSSVGPGGKPNPHVEASRQLARRLAQKINQSLGLRLRRNNGIEDAVTIGGLHMVREPLVPSALVETAFISNPTEALLLRDQPDKFAQAIAQAILEQLAVLAPSVDVFLLVDLSGSFADDLPVFKAQASDIISSLKASNPNIRFGLAKYEDYPIFPFGSQASGDKAYERLVDLTFDTELVLNAILGLFTRNGLDLPQSQLPALYQAATGAGQDLSLFGFPEASIPPGQQANFRDGAAKLFLLWTDASFHLPGDPGLISYPGPSFSQTVDAILSIDPPRVIGISSGGGGISDLRKIATETGALAPPGGVDCNLDEIIDIAEGEPLVCSIASSGLGIGDAIIALVEAGAEINQPPELDVPSEVSVQFSDPLSLNILAIDPDDSGESLSFSVTNLPNNLTVLDNGDGTVTISGIAKAAPGTYNIEITVTDPDGLTDAETVSIVVSQEDARTIYNGPMLVSTPCEECSEATIPLRATIQDITAVPGDPAHDPDPGDITDATVAFVDRENSDAVLCTADVILFDQDDPTVGTAACDWVADIGNGDGADYTIGVVVDGYYTRDATADDSVVVVSKPSSNFITGGGYLLNQDSGGQYAGEPGLNTNFGFNVKFNRKMTNLQGRVTIIVRHNDHVYQIKSNRLESLVVMPFDEGDSNSGVAEFYGRANIQDITDPDNPISIAGNATLHMTMKDNGEPGDADTIGITLWTKNSDLLFSSNWNGVETLEQLLEGGNIKVH